MMMVEADGIKFSTLPGCTLQLFSNGAECVLARGSAVLLTLRSAEVEMSLAMTRDEFTAFIQAARDALCDA